MRSEKEMLDLIIRTAREDERIIAAYLEGSRVDPNAQKDIFRDYDVEYIVRDTAPFIADKSWIDRFGERLFMQYPDDCPFEKSDTKNCYGWLIRFSDGNRLDLHVCTPEHALKNIDICRVLVDKENIIPQDIGKDTTVFNVKKPTQAEFSAVCNEFWWCLGQCCKGLVARRAELYARNDGFQHPSAAATDARLAHGRGKRIHDKHREIVKIYGALPARGDMLPLSFDILRRTGE